MLGTHNGTLQMEWECTDKARRNRQLMIFPAVEPAVFPRAIACDRIPKLHASAHCSTLHLPTNIPCICVF